MADYLVTGASGYLAGLVSRFLASWEGCDRLLGIDIRPPPPNGCADIYYQADVRSPNTTRIIEECRPDVVLHFAYAVDFLHDSAEEMSVNIGGLRKVLEGARRAGSGHVFVTSSTSAYGAYPRAAAFMDEEKPLRINPGLAYARDKVLVEILCRDFKKENPGIKLTIIRPAIVVGPNWGNFWTAFFFALPVVPAIRNHTAPLQFIHEEDLTLIWRLCLEQEVQGTFNACADGAVTMKEAGRILGKSTFSVHKRFAKLVLYLLNRTDLLPIGSPPGMVDFLCYPWLATNRKAKEVLGFDPAYDSRKAFVEASEMKESLLENLAGRSGDGYRTFGLLLDAAIEHSRLYRRTCR